MDIKKGKPIRIEPPWHLSNVPKELAVRFLAVFARFEYALKVSGFATGSGSKAEADWDNYARQIAGTLDLNYSAVSQAAEYILANPPKKQVLEHGSVVFRVRPCGSAGATDAERLLCYVRRVRNNLFHGGKFGPAGEVPDRDRRLVEHALVVLAMCLPLVNEVELAFYN